MIEFYEDLEVLKEVVRRLVEEGKMRVRWKHIRALHPNITQEDVANGLLHGWYKVNGRCPGRYLSWVRSRGRLIRVVFEMRPDCVCVISAFEEG